MLLLPHETTAESHSARRTHAVEQTWGSFKSRVNGVRYVNDENEKDAESSTF
jgi:hypothetical protein